MGAFVTEVQPRWSDMDAFGHVNHANTVTLLEDARVAMLFVEAARHGVDGLARGMVVARLAVDYHAPLVFTGEPVCVRIAVRDLRVASFTLDYTVHSGRSHEDQVVASAQTLMAPYDVANTRPRRLTETERDFLAGFHAGGGVA
ncbi:acyl-CoA thioester hydrolase [Streptoalloteichus tenebrarius]|uniref:Acyl-CoA thioester hydrolase n=1 Tax=Streptoalloteichus tenebrarius (strain ATCC 17920 / DSM 40477 / JCM 4838 / CBS 697.72 / NBRC 16177 / NCIMB 11028 / NRRL B-12390 / A12253. 1 / ISP 5477) TaxID=1933 RepID=A0ABT1HW39_STRSD|nr:thioesterase family protein [Streptoalloteichus tenebrarius]MCP2259740.1 acyl-CoA thioester hydrolase [Streptoalloteichus tenebrarius]BFF00721.1 thioesterase family protein [Streptoalloteichus tenebrarius]